MPASRTLTDRLRHDADGVFRYAEVLFTAFPIEGTEWIALLRQPLEVAYRPVRTHVMRTAFLTGWLFVATAFVAWMASRFYARQIGADERVEREMLFSERILSAMPVGVGVFHHGTGQLMKWNAGFRDMASELGGYQGPPGNMAFTDLAFASAEMFEKTVSHKAPFLAREKQAIDRAGQQHFLSLNFFPIQDQQQQLQGVLLTVEDMTGEATIRRELIAANVAKDQFLALLSHELRNPLSPVTAMVEELEDKLQGDSEAMEALEVIRRNVELEARLIDDLLDITRIAHNKLTLAFENVDAHEVIGAALEICQSDIEQKDIQLHTDLAAERHHLLADPARLHQIFWNLIKNAVKFTPQGGRISIRTCNDRNRLIVEVSDSGEGIDTERIERIFDRFEQGGSAITKRFGGLGLGLAISKSMVDAHGGQIRASSDGPGRGSTFTVEFEIVEPEPAASSKRGTARQPRATASQPRRILVVDDHPDTCRSMKRLLERRGFETLTAATVAEATAAARETQFDLLISDLGLPDGTGFELMEKLRARQNLKGIAISGFGMESDIEKSRRAGFTEHLTKPVNIDQLDKVLARIF